MTLLEFAIFQVIFLIPTIFLINYIRNRPDFEQSDRAKSIKKLYFYGFIGWILTYLRIILIQIYQVLLLINAGVDITDNDAVLAAPITKTYVFILIGPLISGLFEETIRYWLLYKVLQHGLNVYDRKYAPAIFGIAWGYSEVLVLTSGLLGISSVGVTVLLLGIYERIGAVIFHISLTYMVVYARFDNKRSLYIAILVHTLINTVVTVILVELGSLYVIEGAFTIMFVAFVFFVRSHREKMEKQIAVQNE